jgi:hypothetical protein
VRTTRHIACLFFSISTALLATSVGDTYDQVIAEKGKPKSQIEAGTIRVLSYPDATIKVKDGVVVSVKTMDAPPASGSDRPDQGAPTSRSPQAQVAELKKTLNDAFRKVVNIVNQSVESVDRTPDMRIWVWELHPGAMRPDFNTVDVRATQEIAQFDVEDYITMKEHADRAWPGHDLEFNAMTKFFYTDRTVPKKRLTEEEMVAVNGLYRIIGRCETELIQLGATSNKQ